MLYAVFLILLSFSFLLLSLRDFKLSLFVLLGLLPVYLLRFEIGPLPSTLLEVFLLISFIVYFAKNGFKAWLHSYNLHPTTHNLIIPLIFLAPRRSIIISPDPTAAIGLFKAYILEPFILFGILRATFKKDDWAHGLKVLMLSGSILSIVAIIQWLTGAGIPIPWDIERRVTSAFPFPNALGLFLAPILSAGMIFSIREHLWKWFPAFILMAIAIILAKTEAAYIAVPASIALILLVTDLKKKTKRGIIAISILLAATAIFTPAIRTKLFLQDYSGEVRRIGWSESIEMLLDRPLFGAGLSGFESAILPYHDATQFEIFAYPHNIVLNVWSELGLIGLIALVGLIGIGLRQLGRNKTDALTLAASGALLTMLIHGLVDVPFFKNDLAILTIFFFAMLFNKKMPA
jgi:O-antigen ligase